MRRRVSVVLVITGVMCLLAGGLGIGLAGSAGAVEEPGSGFGFFSLSAEAQSIKVIGPDPNIVAMVPEALAQLRSGPVGYSLASAAWPGPVAANAGSLLLLLGNPVCAPPAFPEPIPDIPPPPTCPPFPPDEAKPYLTALNYPVRAENRTGSDEPTVHNGSAGTQMTATVLDDKVEADSVIGAAESSAIGFGSTRSTSTAAVTGPATAEARAIGLVNDISLAGGAVTIGSVTSIARGTTNGLTTTATGATKLSDVQIAGQPVTIDREGVHVLDRGQDLDAATDAVNQILNNFFMQIVFSGPVRTQKDGDVTYTPGSLIFSWTPPPSDALPPPIPKGSGHVISVIIGSTAITASAGPAFSFDFGGGGAPGGLGGGAAPPITGGAGGYSGTTGAGTTGGGTSAPSIITTRPLALAPPVGPGWIALAAVGALLFGAGARRLAVGVLAEDVAGAQTCSAEEGSP